MTAEGTAVPPVRRFRFSTGDEAETEDFIRRMYVDNRIRFDAVPEDARFTATGTEITGIAADRISSAVDYTAVCEPFDYFFFLAVDRGRVRVRSGGTESIVLAGQTSVYPIGVPLDVGLVDLEVRTLRLPAARLAAAAHEISGIDHDDLRFDATTPVSPGMARYWSSVLELTNTGLLAPDTPVAHPLLAEELTRTAALAALRTFPNATMTSHYEPGPGRVGPAALRRALAHIEANPHLPLTLSDIAAAAGTSGRALQHAFARHRGTTPMAHLRRVRLDRAHRDLLAGDPVAVVALRWGFPTVGRFAAAYRAVHGRSPEETRRRRG